MSKSCFLELSPKLGLYDLSHQRQVHHQPHSHGHNHYVHHAFTMHCQWVISVEPILVAHIWSNVNPQCWSLYKVKMLEGITSYYPCEPWISMSLNNSLNWSHKLGVELALWYGDMTLVWRLQCMQWKPSGGRVNITYFCHAEFIRGFLLDLWWLITHASVILKPNGGNYIKYR